MSGLTTSGEYNDVLEDGYTSGDKTVNTTQVEAKIGSASLINRELLYIENRGDDTVYYGPTGVTPATGARLYKDQFAFIPAGQGVAVFLICDTGESATVIVQEFA